MQCAEYDINKAKGLRVFEEIRLEGATIPKGKKLEEAEIEILKKHNIRKLFCAEEELGDVSFQIALRQLCAQICGEATAYSIGDDGMARIVAAEDGVFACLEERCAKFNRFSDFAMLNTIAPFQQVKAGEVIAILQTDYPLIPQAEIDKILYSISGNDTLLQVMQLRPQQVALLYTNFYNNENEESKFTLAVQKLVDETTGLPVEFVAEYRAPHNIKDITDTLGHATGQNHDIIFILCGQRSGSKIDTIRTALHNFADEIVCANIPQTGISDFVVAVRREVKIVCLPYEYSELESPLIKRLILQVIASDKLIAGNFAHLPNANLPKGMELTIREQARLSGNGTEQDKNQPSVAAIVLAAGCSRRAGMNKLLAPIGDEPLFLKAVHAAVRSKAKPVYVISGYQNEEVEKALENLDVNILHNPSFQSGVKTSIMLGLNSLPSSCKAALLIPADMPNITERFLNKMIKNYNPEEGAQLLVASHKGVKYNPVLWSRELFKQADIVPEESNIRVIFPQHEDYTTKVETSNKKMLLDVTYKGDIEGLNE